MSIQSPPLVLIEWEDSSQPTGEWQLLHSIAHELAIRCQTVGFLVRDGRIAKIVAQNIGELDGRGHQVSGVISIPTRAVTRIVRLKPAASVRIRLKAGPSSRR